jgi:hypothetical protein
MLKRHVMRTIKAKRELVSYWMVPIFRDLPNLQFSN